MQTHTIILIAMCGIYALALIFPVAFKTKIKEGCYIPSIKKVAFSFLFAAIIFYWLGQIDLAGVKATQARIEAKKWNEDFRDGVLMTMQGVSENMPLINYVVVILFVQAVLPTKK